MPEPAQDQPTAIARWVSDTEARSRARSAAMLVGVLFVACVGTSSALLAIAEPKPTLSATPNLPVERTVAIDGSTIVVSAARAVLGPGQVRVAGRNQPHNHRISKP